MLMRDFEIIKHELGMFYVVRWVRGASYYTKTFADHRGAEVFIDYMRRYENEATLDYLTRFYMGYPNERNHRTVL